MANSAERKTSQWQKERKNVEERKKVSKIYGTNEYSNMKSKQKQVLKAWISKLVSISMKMTSANEYSII